MKKNKIDQKVFEELVQKVIDGEITRKQITKYYHISARKINLKIMELSKTNPELYMKFIKKFPYKPKEIENINFVELAKKIMKDDKNIEDLAIKYGVSTRTIRRRIGKMKGSREIDVSTGITLDELYRLYKRYRERELSMEDMLTIETLVVGEIQSEGNSGEHRKHYLANLITKYKEYIKQGILKKDAAQMLGYSFVDIYKKEGELKRIETEQSYKMGNCEVKKAETTKTQKEKMQLFKGTLKSIKTSSSEKTMKSSEPSKEIYKVKTNSKMER